MTIEDRVISLHPFLSYSLGILERFKKASELIKTLD